MVEGDAMTKRYIPCARVSSKEQGDNGTSLDSQAEACQKYIDRLGGVALPPIKEDVSGITPIADRPRQKAILDMLRRGEADGVIWFTVDRFFRDDLEARLQVRQWLRAGVEIHFCDSGPLKSERDLIFLMKSMMAADERDRIIERTTRGRRSVAATRWLGAGYPAYGYRREGHGRGSKLIVCEPEAKVVQRIYTLYVNGGLSLRAIAALLEREHIPTPHNRKVENTQGWNVATVSNILTNPLYHGLAHYGSVTCHLPELAIVSQALYDQAVERKKENIAASARNVRHDYLMRTRISCKCGRSMECVCRRDTHLYYRCHEWTAPKNPRACWEPSIPAGAVDALAWDWLKKLMKHPEEMEQGYADYLELQRQEHSPLRDRLDLLDDSIRDSEKESADLYKLIKQSHSAKVRAALEKDYDAETERLAGYQAERDKLAQELERLEANDMSAPDFAKWAADVSKRLPAGNSSFERRRQLVEVLDVRAKVEYKDIRGVRLFCKLGYAEEWQALPGGFESSST
jgi:DNA invertase Pin-like site-specific DNA recombinase